MMLAKQRLRPWDEWAGRKTPEDTPSVGKYPHSRSVLSRQPPYHTRRFSRFLGAYPDRECCSLRLLLRIAEDSVLAHIQPLQFLLGTDPKPDRHLDDVEDQQGRHKDEGERGQHSAQLHQELVKSSPIEQSGLSDRQQLDPLRRGKQPVRQRTPNSRHPMDRDGTDRIVNTPAVHRKHT